MEVESLRGSGTTAPTRRRVNTEACLSLPGSWSRRPCLEDGSPWHPCDILCLAAGPHLSAHWQTGQDTLCSRGNTLAFPPDPAIQPTSGPSLD